MDATVFSRLLHAQQHRYVTNYAGGAVHAVSWSQLFDRFITLGTTGGTFYATEQRLQEDIAPELLTGYVQAGPSAIMELAARIPTLPLLRPSLLLTALALVAGSNEMKHAVVQHIHQLAPTLSHLLTVVSYYNTLRLNSYSDVHSDRKRVPHGRSWRRAVSAWLTRRDAQSLAYQMLKYKRRDGVSVSQLLRYAHPKPPTDTHSALFHWALYGWPSVGDEPHPDHVLRLVWAVERLHRLHPTDVATAVDLIATYRMVREMVPTSFLQHRSVWAALVPFMPIHALLRSIVSLSRIGVFSDQATRPHVLAMVERRLTDEEVLRSVHPLHIYLALTTYKAGYSAVTREHWSVDTDLVRILTNSLDRSFAKGNPSNKRIVVALDISGSMRRTYDNAQVSSYVPIHIGALLLAYILRIEPYATAYLFTDRTFDYHGTTHRGVMDTITYVCSYPSGNTDISSPLFRAMQDVPDADAVVLITDNETWKNKQPIHVVMDRYRAITKKPTKLIVIGLTATRYTVADPNDPYAYNIAGFSTTVPDVLSSLLGAAVTSTDD